MAKCEYASMYCQKIENKEVLIKESCLECLKQRDKDYYKSLGWMHHDLVIEIKRSIRKLEKEIKQLKLIKLDKEVNDFDGIPSNNEDEVLL